MSLLKKAFAKYEKRGQHLQSELGTLEWDTFNPDFLIRIYKWSLLISCLIHSFLDILQKNQKPVF